MASLLLVRERLWAAPLPFGRACAAKKDNLQCLGQRYEVYKVKLEDLATKMQHQRVCITRSIRRGMLGGKKALQNR